jgi:molecular chaperone HscB
MVQCPSCARPSEPRLTCPDCGAPLGAELDLFAALGVPRKLALDPLELERIYHEAGRRIHPDRFATGTPAVRQASLKSTALLTRSYRTLRDPVSRGRYWLELLGEKLAENNKRVPPELAEMVFEVQEQLGELRTTHNGSANALGAAIKGRRAELEGLVTATQEELERNFARWDEGAGERQELVNELKSALSKIAYLRTLTRDVDRALESATADKTAD